MGYGVAYDLKNCLVTDSLSSDSSTAILFLLRLNITRTRKIKTVFLYFKLANVCVVSDS